MTEQTPEPPRTIREVGIELFYLRKDIRTLTKALEGTPSKKEVEDLEKRIVALENFINKIKTKIAGYATTAIVLMVLAQYGLTQFFK